MKGQTEVGKVLKGALEAVRTICIVAGLALLVNTTIKYFFGFSFLYWTLGQLLGAWNIKPTDRIDLGLAWIAGCIGEFISIMLWFGNFKKVEDAVQKAGTTPVSWDN